jgi:glycosyltransferase involved in cell wall biosynthesis
MDLSIIIPVYNTEKWLPEMLGSLKAQKHDYKVEIIFVLDSCTDNSKKTIEESGIADVIYECEVHSCGLARNKGLEFATGDYIWFLDSDDYLTESTAIQEALDFVQGKQIVRIPFESDKFNSPCYAMVWQYVFSKELIKGMKFREIQPAEDNDFMDRVFKRINPMRVEVYDFPLYFYRYLREGSNMERHKRGEKI